VEFMSANLGQKRFVGQFLNGQHGNKKLNPPNTLSALVNIFT